MATTAKAATLAPAAKPAVIASVALPPSKPASGSNYALPPLDSAAAAPSTTQTSGQGFVVQAGAFANKVNADRAASDIGGVVDLAGKFYRVRTSPYPDQKVAEASLAKVKGAGYSGARIYSTQ